MTKTGKNVTEQIGKHVKIFDIKGTGERLMKGVSKHSTLITFGVVTAGVIALIHFASRDIPKAKESIKDIQNDNSLSKKEKKSKITKTVVKNCWKTTVIAIGTILLVTGTSAINAVNTATTITSLTNALNLAEGKVNSYEKAINDIPDKEIRNTVKQTVRHQESTKKDVNIYKWRDRYLGTIIEATCQQIINAEIITNARIESRGRQYVRDFYDALELQGAIFEYDRFPSVSSYLGWDDPINVCMDCQIIDDDGETEWFFDYREPKEYSV